MMMTTDTAAKAIIERLGEMVTTGTLTAILPVGPGETWSTAISGLDLPGFTIAFEP